MKTKRERIDRFGVDDFSTSVDEVIEILQGLKDKYPGYTDLRLEFDYESSYELWGTRPETDVERKRRLTTARRLRENRKKEKEREKEKEIKLLHKLKQRYPEE